MLQLAPRIGRFGPLGPLPVAISGIPPEDAGMGDLELLARAPAVLVLAVWIGVAFAAAAALFQRRDLE